MSLLAEQFYGLIISIALYQLTNCLSRKQRIVLAIYAIIFAYVFEQLDHLAFPGATDFHSFNWIPFNFQFGRIFHIREILNTVWIFLALSFLVLSLQPEEKKKTFFIGIALVTLICFTIEWQQQYLQKTYADITDVLVAAITWGTPFLHPLIRQGELKT